jgi:hypothetical protein
VVVKKVKSVYGLKSVQTARVAKEGSHAAPMHVLFALHLFSNNMMNNHVLLQIVEYLSLNLHLMCQVSSSRACDADFTHTRASLAFLFTKSNNTLHNTVFVPTYCTVY